MQSPDIPAPEADAIDTVDRDTGFAALEALLDTAGDDEIPASQEEVENLANCVFATVEESISPAHNDGGDEVGPQMGGEPSLERAKSFDNLETLQVYLDTQCALDCAAELPATQPMFEDGPTPVLHRTSGPVAQPEQIEGKEESKPTAEAMIVESERETFNQQLAMAAGGGGTSRPQEWDSAVPSGDKAPIEIDSQQATPVKDDASAPSGRAIFSFTAVGPMTAQQRMAHYATLMNQVETRLAGYASKGSKEDEQQVESPAPGHCPKIVF